jgi:hypothetical protein
MKADKKLQATRKRTSTLYGGGRDRYQDRSDNELDEAPSSSRYRREDRYEDDGFGRDHVWLHILSPLSLNFF